ncbi:MAG: hypothetical protein RIM33_03020 [Alphaproteobacteria bacterium]
MSLFSPLSNAVLGKLSAISGASTILGSGVSSNRLASGNNALANIQATLDQAKTNAGKQQIMASVQLRIQGIAEGIVEPKEIWEKVAGFLTLTGQPFVYSVDDQGQVEIQEQSLDTVANLPAGRRDKLRTALERLDEVRLAVDTVVTKGSLRNKLVGAVSRIGELENFAPAKEQWERDFQLTKSTGRPVLVGLDANGGLRAINQLDSNFDYVEDPEKRLVLQQAGRELQNILNGTGTATKSWQFEALGFKASGDDYFLDVNDENEVVVLHNTERRPASGARPLYQQNRNQDYHIIPSFLKPAPEDDRIFREKWEQEASALIQAKKPFHLDLVGDRIVVRETNFASVRRLDLLDTTSSTTRVAQATVNILS